MALNAYQTALKNALQKKKEPSLNLNPLDYPQGAATGATAPATAAPVTGTANTGNLTAAQIQSMREDAKRAADTAVAVNNAKTTAEKNAILRQSAMQNAVKQGVPGAAQILATEQALQQKAPGVSLTQQPKAQQTAFQAYLESAAPQQQYLWRNMGENEMHTMNEGEQRLWKNAMQGYANGDYSAFNRDFQTAGNWGSYVDANGKVNGMLRYAGDGVGGYIPVNEGKVMQGIDPRHDYVFYGPNGEAYTMDANGNLFNTGTWTDQYDSVMKNGYYKNDVNDYGDRMFIGKDGQAYTYNNVPDEKLAEWGYVRRNGGIFYEPQTVAANNGGSWEQNNPLWKPAGNGGGNGGGNTPSGGSSYSGRSSSGGITPTQPVPNYQPTQTQPVQTQPVQTPYQAAIEEWSYGTAPEWEGTEYEQKRDAALEAAQNMRWDGSEYQAERDRLLEEAMRPYEGSPYDQQRDEALARYGEEWQGSEYQQKRDDALRRAEEMKWNYDPNTDPVWQALQKQYRREGDRATQEAMAQAAMRTGGLANSYAVTAASQAGDYYAAQLSDRLPQVYQDAYNRYLQEFQRQMGISDQYQGFDDREYSRWADQQGKNLDLADRYNQYGQQDYDQYRDRVSQQLSGADRYNGYDQTEYQRYLDQYGLQLDAADRYNNYGATEYDRYRDRLGQWNTDRNFDYGRYRDRIGDARYADETQYSRNYQAQRDAILDSRADREWAQQLREYADSQNWKATEWQQYLREYGDQLSEQERQWAYQMARDAESDRRYNDETAYQRAMYADETAYDRGRDAAGDERYDTQWQQSLREYENDQRQQEINNAWKRIQTTGYISEADAALLGIQPGAYSGSAASSGGRSSGGRYYSDEGYPSDEEDTGDYRTAVRQNTQPAETGAGLASRYVSGLRHENGTRMTEGWQKWWPTIRDAFDQGATEGELRAAIKKLIQDNVIQDYEENIMLDKLGLETKGLNTGWRSR